MPIIARPEPSPLVAECQRCGQLFELEQWLRLHLCGEQHIHDKQGAVCLELRNCPCGDTLSVEIACDAFEENCEVRS